MIVEDLMRNVIINASLHTEARRKMCHDVGAFSAACW